MGARVLVLDDDPIVAALMRRVLSSEHEVTVLGDPVAALALVTSGVEIFDVILCDVTMTPMSGIEFYDALVLADRLDIVQSIVFVTGGVFSDEAETFLAGVPNPCLGKPFDVAKLKDLVRTRVRREV